MKQASVLVVVDELTAHYAGRANALAFALQFEVNHVVFAGWTSGTIPSRFLNRDIPVIDLHGPLRSDWPFDVVVYAGELSDASQYALRDMATRFGTVALPLAQAPSAEQVLANLPEAIKWQPDELPEPSPASGKRDVVVFWKQNDTGLYGRRPDMLVRYLAERNDIGCVVVFDAPINETAFVSKRGQDWFDQDRHVYVRSLRKALSTATSGYFPSNVSQHVAVMNKRWGWKDPYLHFIDKTLRQQGVIPDQALFLIYPKMAWGELILDTFKPWQVIADVVDDHRAWPGVSEKKRNELTKHYQALLERASVVFTNCVPVKLAMLEFHDQVLRIPNACDTLPPTRISDRNRLYVEQIKQHKGPIYGYVGNLESKIDIELLGELARVDPNSLLVLVGSTHANPEVRQLAELPNVLMTGVLPYEEAGALVQYFDVGLVPHKFTELTENMNPLKVFVYLSHAVPVVATEVPNISDFKYVYRVHNHAEFIDRVREVARLDREALRNECAQYVKIHSWQSRFSKVFDKLLA